VIEYINNEAIAKYFMFGCRFDMIEKITKRNNAIVARDPETKTSTRRGCLSIKSEPKRQAKVNAIKRPVEENSASSASIPMCSKNRVEDVKIG
jgi:hypothetical protein